MSSYIKKTGEFKRLYGYKKTIEKIKNTIIKKTWNYKAPDPKELSRERKSVFEYSPKISLLVPMYNTDLVFFKELIKTIQEQTYQKWELCLADGSETECESAKYAKHLQETDNRIKYKKLNENEGISGNTNQALNMATGDYVALVDHDDLLTLDALYELVKTINSNEDVDCIYSDEDKFDDGIYFDPTFKPDFDIDMLRAGNYITHLFCTKTAIARKVQFVPEYDGAQDFDFIFRCSEKAKKVYHIPKILYHWRCHRMSTAQNPESKMYAYEAGTNAIRANIERSGLKCSVIGLRDQLGYSRVIYRRTQDKTVNVITTAEAAKRISKTIHTDNVILREIPDFTLESLNGCINSLENDEYVLFISPDTLDIDGRICEEFAGILDQRADIYSVFGCAEGTEGFICSAGYILGLHGSFGRAFFGYPSVDTCGYAARRKFPAEMYGSDFSCLMLRTESWKNIGGLDEEFKNIDYAIMDLNMRLHEKSNGRALYWPFIRTKLNRKATAEDCADPNENDYKLFVSRWKHFIKNGDPTFNPNFSLITGWFMPLI